MTRIPHPRSDTETRQAFQALADRSDVITTGASDYILVGQGIGVAPVWQALSAAIDHGGLGGLGDVADHPDYLLADGTRDLTDDLIVTALKTIDGRDLSVDGTKLDGIEALADVTDATNVAAAGAAMSGGAFHDGFSDSVANEHIDHTGITLTAGSGIAGGGTIASNRTFDLDINSLSVATIVSGDFVPFWDITATATNKKTTFANFEAALTHANLIGGHNLTTDIDHDQTTNYDANKHIDHTGVSISTSTGLTGGGDLTSTRTLSLSHLGIESLSDAGADKILFWDDGGTATGWLAITGSGKGIVTTDLEINAGFVDRGDPATYDFAFVAFTMDATWRNLDLSSIIPAGAYAVNIGGYIKGTAANQYILIRKNGNSNAINTGRVYTQVGATYIFYDLIIPVDSNRIIEYYGHASLDDCTLAVKGWFI